MKGAVEKQQKLSEEDDRRWQRLRWSGKESGDVGSRKARLSGQTVLCLCFSCSFVFFLFFLLSLALELFPEGPLQLRNRQSEGEGAVGL